MQRRGVVLHDLMARVKARMRRAHAQTGKVGAYTGLVPIEEWAVQMSQKIGRQPHDRSALANASVAKAMLELSTSLATSPNKRRVLQFLYQRNITKSRSFDFKIFVFFNKSTAY